MLIDSHAHLDDSQFDRDREEVIQRSFSSGVEKIINIGAGLRSSERSLKIAAEHKDIFTTIGLHPHYFMKHKAWGVEHKNQLIKLAESEKVVAIGEIGLEYFSPDGQALTEKQKYFQKEGFIFQLELARKIKLPVVLHCRGNHSPAGSKFRETEEAYEDLWKIVEEYPELKIVFHSFGGRLDFSQKVITRENALFSFAGNITYNKPNSEILEIIKIIPIEKIMLETDCPYLAPVPVRGKRNEPGYVRYVAEFISQIKGLDKTKIEEITTHNCLKFFGIDFS